MSKRRLLVTGSRGFVGRNLLTALRTERWSSQFTPVDFVDPETGYGPDLRDQPAVCRAISAAEPHAVVHLAAIAAPRQAAQDPAAAWHVNTLGTFNLARAVLDHAPDAQFIFAGSSEAYGASFNKADAPIGEAAPLEPMSPYGATKAAADIMLRQMVHEGLKATVFRPFNHTGPGQGTGFVVPAFAHQIASIEQGLQPPVLKVGNLEAQRDFLDVRDIVEAYLRAAVSDDGASEKVVNLSTGSPVSISWILHRLIEIGGVDAVVEVDPARYLPNTIPVMSGNNAEAKASLDWSPAISLDQTLHDVLGEARLSVTGSR